jgi:LDH2 family malate/lactate/ureidoglycolate dehydrogenase
VKTVPAATLDRIMRSALLRRGLAAEHAGWVVDGLLETSLRGIDTHGVRLFPTYIAELDGGRSRARPELAWVAGVDGGGGAGGGNARAARLLDAGGALGLVAGRFACDEAARLARENGVSTVAVRNSNHFGAGSVYTLAMARQGVLGLSFTNSDALVAPFNGLRPFFGTNPISMAVQGEGEELFCTDFATSQVSYSKVRHHKAHGIPLQPGWAVTADGRDVAEIAEAGEEGAEVSALKPLGNHKGQCLAMMVEILCAVLTGMPLDHQLSHLYIEPYDEPRKVSHLFLALDVAAFQSPAAFRGGLSRFLELVREQPAVDGERVVVPGDPEAASAAARRQAGIPLEDAEIAAFERIDREAPTLFDLKEKTS